MSEEAIKKPEKDIQKSVLKRKKKLPKRSPHPLRYTSVLLRNEKDEELRNLEKVSRHAYVGVMVSGNLTDRARIRHEHKKPEGNKNVEFIRKKQQDIQIRGNLKSKVKQDFINSMSQEEDFGNMADAAVKGISAKSYVGAVLNKTPFGPSRISSAVWEKAAAFAGSRLRDVQYRMTSARMKAAGSFFKTDFGSRLHRKITENRFLLNTARAYSAAKKKVNAVTSKSVDVAFAPVRAGGAVTDFAKEKLLKPVAFIICGILLFQLLIAAISGSGGSGAVSSIILDTKEHFNSFQNAFDNDEAEFQRMIDARAKGYANTLNDNGDQIKYRNVKINYDSVTTNNIDDLLTVMAVLMDQSQEENHEEALKVFNELYFTSHSFNVQESPLYYCSGCVRHTETDEEGNRISWYECYGHVDAEINVHVMPFDELMLTYDFTAEQTDWAYAIRNADDFSKLYNIKSMTESIAGESGFYIDDIKVNASSKKIPDNGSSMKIVYFTQGSGAEWANVPFGGGTIASSGCSVTSLAMVLSYLKGGSSSSGWIYPNEIVAAIAEKYGNYNRFYVAPYGQDGHGLFPAMASYYGVNCQEISSSSIINALKDGRPVIMSCVPGEFTKQGHFIVLTGLSDDGYIMVNDPNGSHADKSYKIYTLNEIQNNGKGWWMFWN